MSVISSIEDAIISNIASTLLTINGAPNYVNIMQAQQVDAALKFPDQIPDDAWPHFSISFRDSKREKHPTDLKKIIQVDIVASFHFSQASEVASWLSDIEKVLAVDIQRGRNAYETWIPSMIRNSDVLDEIQIYIINVECRTLAAFGTL